MRVNLTMNLFWLIFGIVVTCWCAGNDEIPKRRKRSTLSDLLEFCEVSRISYWKKCIIFLRRLDNELELQAAKKMEVDICLPAKGKDSDEAKRANKIIEKGCEEGDMALLMNLKRLYQRVCGSDPFVIPRDWTSTSTLATETTTSSVSGRMGGVPLWWIMFIICPFINPLVMI